MLGFDHPESLQFEMQLTWVEDTWTVPGQNGEQFGQDALLRKICLTCICSGCIGNFRW